MDGEADEDITLAALLAIGAALRRIERLVAQSEPEIDLDERVELSQADFAVARNRAIAFYDAASQIRKASAEHGLRFVGRDEPENLDGAT